MIALIPVLLCVVGALLYALSSNPKIEELGRITFAAGIFAIAFNFATEWAGLHLSR